MFFRRKLCFSDLSCVCQTLVAFRSSCCVFQSFIVLSDPGCVSVILDVFF